MNNYKNKLLLIYQNFDLCTFTTRQMTQITRRVQLSHLNILVHLLASTLFEAPHALQCSDSITIFGSKTDASLYTVIFFACELVVISLVVAKMQPTSRSQGAMIGSYSWNIMQFWLSLKAASYVTCALLAILAYTDAIASCVYTPVTIHIVCSVPAIYIVEFL